MPCNRQTLIFCDESDKEGRHYSNFYDAVMVSARDTKPANKNAPPPNLQKPLTQNVRIRLKAGARL